MTLNAVLVPLSVALLVQLLLTERLARRVHSARLVRLVRLVLLVQLALLVRLALPPPMTSNAPTDHLLEKTTTINRHQPATHLLMQQPFIPR
jgi:hypothetical protein